MTFTGASQSYDIFFFSPASFLVEAFLINSLKCQTPNDYAHLPSPLRETGLLEKLENMNVFLLPPTGVRLFPGGQAFVMKRFWECSIMMTFPFPPTYQRHKGLPNSSK